MTAERFRETAETIESFGDSFLVRCPRCAARAHVAPAPGEPHHDRPRDRFGHTVRLTRPTCSHTAESRMPKRGSRPLYIGGPVDFYFGQPVWLQTACATHTLWAYNARHPDYLEGFVAARLREPPLRVTDEDARNSALASRLPGWLKNAKNRDEVLRCIQRLRRMLD